MDDETRALLVRAAEALRLTQEYVGSEMLPNEPGWSHFDARVTINSALGLPPPKRTNEVPTDAAVIKHLQDKGAMPKSSETAPDCLECMNGRALQLEDRCSSCKRFTDNYGELFPMR